MCGEAVAGNGPNITFVGAKNILQQDRVVIVQNLLLYSRQIPSARLCDLIVFRIALTNGCRNRFVLRLELGQVPFELGQFRVDFF